MRSKTLCLSLIALACTVGAALAQTNTCPGPVGDGPQGIQQQDRDQLQSCDPDLDQDRTRLRACLPEEVQQAVDDMSETREQYQTMVQERKKEATECTEEEREQLREQLRDQLKEQAQDREQIRERLQELRECLPSHQQLMDQAREQVQHTRRGE